MAGHSKWANIKHRKAAQDVKRGKVFTRLIREITGAVRSGGGADINTNPRCRIALDKALTARMAPIDMPEDLDHVQEARAPADCFDAVMAEWQAAS